MKCTITFCLNGKKASYEGSSSARLLDVLRDYFHLTGTKCGCKEGECGACSVIVDGKLRNSCLVAMGSINGMDIVTIEGYRKTERFAALDEAFKSVSAVQCGFCIPAMILASECLLAKGLNITDEDIRTAISGNLCRCTGYNSIVKAVHIAASKLASSSAYSSSINAGCNPDNCAIAASIAAETSRDYGEVCARPSALSDALKMRKNSELIPYCGGTDLMVSKRCEDKKYLFLNNVHELQKITRDDEYISFGAACTFTQVMEHELTPRILADMCSQIAAPAIRNAGTIGGNIANGSAKADSALIFAVTDSKLRLLNEDGERIVSVNDFYPGKGKTDLKSDELIAQVLMPASGLDNYYLKKAGARNALSISRVSFAAILDIQDDVIKNCAVAFGAVIDKIIRLPGIDNMLIGKTVSQAIALKDEYLKAYDEAIVPRPGRVSAEYRKDVCMNLLHDFFDEKIMGHTN